VTLNNDADKIGAKIRNAQLDKIPYMLVVGEKEAAVQSVAVRHAKRGDLGVKPIADFIAEVIEEVKERKL
jgi:threonyl-tRNA synthetase